MWDYTFLPFKFREMTKFLWAVRFIRLAGAADHQATRCNGRSCSLGAYWKRVAAKRDSPEKPICRRRAAGEVRRHSDKSGGLSSRINASAGRLERRCDLFVYLCVCLTTVLLGRLAEGAPKKPTEMTLIRKSAVGRHVGD
jgi:hypothetical protein